MRKGNNKDGNPNFKGAKNPKIMQTLEHPLWPGESKSKGITTSLPPRIYEEVTTISPSGSRKCPWGIKLSIEHLIEAFRKSGISPEEIEEISSSTESQEGSLTIKIKIEIKNPQ